MTPIIEAATKENEVNDFMVQAAGVAKGGDRAVPCRLLAAARWLFKGRPSSDSGARECRTMRSQACMALHGTGGDHEMDIVPASA